MYNTGIIVVQCSAILESVVIIAGNIFTIFVFWKHRNRLKRTFFLLINLAVADLLVGITETIALGALNVPWQLEGRTNSVQNKSNATTFQTTFGFASLLFLTLISLERACALIWPLRHRVASAKVYIFSATSAWVAAIFAGAFTLLTPHDMDFADWMLVLCCVVVLCLFTTCASYLVIRKRLSCRVPAIEGAHNRPNELQQNAKLSRTPFIVIATSLLLWTPSMALNCIHYFCLKCAPLLVVHIFNLFRLANSLVNPIIYSFRIPMFRETFKRVKLCKQSRKYTINYTLWNLIEDSNETALPRPQASLVGLNAVRMELWVSYAITIKHRAPSYRDVWWRVRFFAVISNVSHIKASKYKTLSRNCQIKRNTLQKKKNYNTLKQSDLQGSWRKGFLLYWDLHFIKS